MLLTILSAFYDFIHLRGPGWQAVVSSTGDYSALYLALQFVIINKLIGIAFSKEMYYITWLKKLYIGCATLLGLLLAIGYLNNVMILILVDLLVMIITSITGEVGFGKVADLYRVSNICKKKGLQNFVTFAIGMLSAILLAKGQSRVVLYSILLIHVTTTLITLYLWNIEIKDKTTKEAIAKNKLQFKFDNQIMAYVVSGVLVSIAGTFDLYYVKLSVENGYSASLIATLASAGALITGVFFIVASNHFFSMDSLRKFVVINRILLGLTPILVMVNFPAYPFFKAIILATESFLITIYQSIFMHDRDKTSIRYLNNVKSTAGYATFSGGVALISAGYISLWALVVLAVIASLLSAYLFYLMREANWKPIKLSTVQLQKLDMVGIPVVLCVNDESKYEKSETGDVGCIVDELQNGKIVVQMDNGEKIEDYPTAFVPFYNATLRQVVTAHNLIGKEVKAIKTKLKTYSTVDDVWFEMNPDVTIIKDHSYANGTLEVSTSE